MSPGSSDPPVRRTWGRRGRTPLIALSRRRRRINASGWLCVAPDGSHTRLVFTCSRTGYTQYHFPELIDQVHERLGAPLVLVWDNHPSHRTRWLRHRPAQRTWLSVVYLPRYAPAQPGGDDVVAGQDPHRQPGLQQPGGGGTSGALRAVLAPETPGRPFWIYSIGRS
ncbi:transposase [Nocardiopsis rhodophaea]|uniref:transposase n=1 Tax=Nocardiopsis rhodophaea TaxID=280238 RepID=UPI0031D2FA7E